MKEFVIPTLVLAIICLVCTGALAATNGVAAPVIAENARIAADSARQEVLPAGEGFAPVEGYTPEGDVIDVYAAGNGAGYVVTTQANGFAGPVKVMTGINPDGVIDQVKVLEQAETSGLGSRVADPKFTVSSGATFCGQLSGKDAAFGDQMELIVGSTVSSNAVKNAVALAFEVVDQVKGA